MKAHYSLRIIDKQKIALTLLLCIVVPWLLTGCPPTPPCDEKIKDPKVVEAAIQSSPVIQELNSELKQRNFSLGNCFVGGKVSAVIQYELPETYSKYQVAYADQISISYVKDGTLEFNHPTGQPVSLQTDTVLNYFKNRIRELENDPRVSEVITKTNPDPSNPVVPLYGQEQVLRSGNNRVEYNFFNHAVRGYILSNDIEWKEYPEIQQAHIVMEKHLLVGELANCSIGRGEMHAYTQAQFHDSPATPWFITVALQCTDGWKDAYVQVNNDGSYERLGIVTDYKSQ